MAVPFTLRHSYSICYDNQFFAKLAPIHDFRTILVLYCTVVIIFGECLFQLLP